MMTAARRLGFVCLIAGIFLAKELTLRATVAIGRKLDDCTAVLCADSQQELSAFLALSAEHVVGVALPLPAPTPLLFYLRPPRIQTPACNGSGYEPPVPHLRGPPLA